VDWQRSDDLGNSWRTVAQSFEDEANPRPVASATVDWALWSVTHGFVAATADQGALIRAHACFTPPDVPAPPCVTGPATRLNVLQQSALPVIVDAPRSVLVTTGQAASFTASAGGAPAPSLQWQTRAANDTGAWADVSSGTGATTGSYTTAPLSLADNGRQYRVVATNAVASAASPGVTASVSDLDVPPTITTQPASLNVATGSDAAFAVAALGTETLSYQWSLDGTPITGATTPVLRLPAVTAGNAGSYVVVVTNIAGTVASDPAILTVSPGALAPVAPTIVTQPAAVTVHAGDTATFAVGMSGSGPLSFQWRKDGAAIAGATEAAITLASAVPADAGAYSVVVGNAAGTVTSADAALAVTVIPPPVVTAPTISTQPATLVVVPGGAATLAVAASGTGPLAYQWSLGGTPVAGATGPVLTIPSVGPADAGSYTVTVSNVAGSVTSAPAQLILVGAPVITTQPASASAVEGSMATFTVAATGDAPHYQWERNGVPMAGAVAASYTTPLLTAGDSGAIFDVLVYNAVGLVFSHPAVLTVTPAPSVSMPPSTGKLSAGPSHTCAIKTDGTVACWGHNSSREVTVVAPFGDQDLPVVVSGLSGMAQVAVGFQRTCAIGGLGNLVCWGRGSTGVQPLLDGAGVAITGARAVTLGDYHGCFIDAGTGVQCWGDNSVGQLGQGTISLTPMATPVVVSRGGSALTGVVGLSAGGFYTCALTSVGDVVCWGQGAIGDGSVMPGGGQRAVYAAVPAVTGASAMVSGGAHACAVLAAGGMKCWGANASAQLGNRNTTDQLAPVSVVDPSGLLVGVTLVAAQSDTTCVIPASGQVVCWGAVRPASLTGVLTYGPVVKSSLAQRVVGLASGGNHSCALVADGSLECWGANQYGQLGVGGFISLDTGGPSPPGTSVFGGAIFW
jgi:alpha-tubulin suppressor-like RCC1 family protein